MFFRPVSVILMVSLFAPVLVFGASTSTIDANLTPDSPFYFLKTWREQIQLFFTFNVEQKAKQYLHLAEVRLAEYQKMIEKGKQEIAEKTLSKYEDQLNRALAKAEELKSKGKDIKDLSQKVEEATSKHLQVLQENLAKVPEAAKKGIERAIEASSKVLDKAVETVGRKSIHQLESEFYGKMDNWQTYRNEKYGFEFRYPEAFKFYSAYRSECGEPEMLDNSSNSSVVRLDSPDLSIKTTYPYEATVCVPKLEKGASVLLRILTPDRVLPNRQDILKIPPGDNQRQFKTLEIDKQNAVYFLPILSRADFGRVNIFSGTIYTVVRFFDSNDQSEYFEISLASAPAQKDYYLSIFDSILSTFKFISPN